MNHEELQEYIMKSLKAAKDLDKDKVIRIVKNCLKDYPRELQSFSDWFEKHSDIVLKKIQEHPNA